MSRLGPWMRLYAAVLLALGCAMSATPASADQPGESDRQILVMIRMAPPHVRLNGGYGGKYGDAAAQAARDRTARRIARNNRLELVDSWPMPLLGVDCFVMRVPVGTSVEAAVEAVSKSKSVAWSQGMATYETQAATQGDPLAPAQPTWNQWQLGQIHKRATGRGVKIAIVDSKVETGHPDLAGQFAASRDFVSMRGGPAEIHGTGVAGLIAAKADNGLGIAGVAPDARVMALRACSQNGNARTTCNGLNVAKALHYAIDANAQVINLSLSGPSDRLLAQLIRIALKRGVSVVAAFDSYKPQGGFPASLPGVIAVADESLRSLPQRVYAAPGRDVPTTRPGGKWHLVNGNSYAAAQVSGLLALVRQSRGRHARLAVIRKGNRTIDACATVLSPRECDCDCPVARIQNRERK